MATYVVGCAASSTVRYDEADELVAQRCESSRDPKGCETRLCSDGVAAACIAVGDRFLEGQGLYPDVEPAIGFYEKACAFGDGRGCAWAVSLRWDEDPDAAGEKLTTMCEGGELAACDEVLGHTWANKPTAFSERVEAKLDAMCKGELWGACASAGDFCLRRGDLECAAELAGRACHQGDSLGCVVEAATVLTDSDATAEAHADAVRVMGAACEDGEAIACAYVGQTVLDDAENREEAQRGIKLLERSCDSGAMTGCNALAHVYSAGRWIPQDLPRAKDLASWACDNGEELGCVMRALLMLRDDDTLAARSNLLSEFERLCEETGIEEICAVNEATAYMLAPAQNAERRPELEHACDEADNELEAIPCIALAYGAQSQGELDSAIPYFSRACNLDVLIACVGLAAALAGAEENPDRVRAAAVSERACERGSSRACTMAGIWLTMSGEPADEARGMTILESSCERGIEDSCVMFATNLTFGLGGYARDVERATTMLEKYCEAGNPHACESLEKLAEDLERSEEGPPSSDAPKEKGP